MIFEQLKKWNIVVIFMCLFAGMALYGVAEAAGDVQTNQTIQAENYYFQWGTGLNGAGTGVSYREYRSDTKYNLTVTSTDYTTFRARVASGGANGGGTYLVTVDGHSVARFSIPNTGGWVRFQTVSVPVSIPDHLDGGTYVLRIYKETNSSSGVIDWVQFR